MLDDDEVDSLSASEAFDIGRKRFANMSLFDSPVYLPPDPAWAIAVKDFAHKQVVDAKDIETMLCGYIELLGRAKAFVDFWESNVGPTEDWPMSVVGESDEVEACLAQRMAKLKLAVSFIEESACS